MKTSLELNFDFSNGLNSICEGSGAPTILIHGLAASMHDWKDLIPELIKSGYSAYTLDLPGHGKSLKPNRPEVYNIQNYLACFDAWISSLRLTQPAVLVGHSLGGYIAIQYAIHFPEQVSALVLCDPLYDPNQLPLLLRMHYPNIFFKQTVYKKIPAWVTKRMVDLASLSIRNGYQLPDDVRQQTANDYMAIQPGVFYVISTLSDLTPILSQIKQPTLCLWGEHDLSLSPRSFQKILRLIPNSTGGVIKGAGHVPHQSHPIEFNQKVITFLKSLDEMKKAG